MKIKFLLMIVVLCFVIAELKAESSTEIAPSPSKNGSSSQEVLKKLKEQHNENTIFDDLYNIQ